MAIAYSYDRNVGALKITGLASGSSYTISRYVGAVGETLAVGHTLTSYTDYFVLTGVTYDTYITSSGGAIGNIGSTTNYTTYDGSFLIGSGASKFQQIVITYDENVTSYKPVRKDSVQETIGGKYPFVIRNASLNYETMEFSGMITALMDPDNFSTFGASNAYGNYDLNYIQERNFRTWFESWINDGSPKVLKTSTEGFKIVRVHNVSFTPIRQTGRVLYNFSCTFTEIADYTNANLLKYKFINYSTTEFYPAEFLYPADLVFPNNP